MKDNSYPNSVVKYASTSFSMLSFIILISIPAMVIGTFIHELGHGIAVMLLDPNALVYIDLHGSLSASFSIDFWWQDFIQASAGILTSTLSAVVIWKIVLPRINRDNTYLRLFLVIYVAFQLIQGPLYMASAFVKYGDTWMMASSIEWFFGTSGIQLDFALIFGFIGSGVSFFILVAFFKAFNGDMVRCIEKLANGNLGRGNKVISILSWVLIFGIIALFGFFFINLIRSWGSNAYMYSRRPDGENIAALVGVPLMLLSAYILSKKLMEKRAPTWHVKNRIVLAVAVICILAVVYVDPVEISIGIPGYYYSTSQGLRRDQKLITDSDNLYRFYRFDNFSRYQSLGSENLMIDQFNYSSFQWDEPMIIYNSYDLDKAINEYATCLDGAGRLWMFSLQYPRQYEGPYANFSLIVEAWNLTIANFDGSYHTPTTHINKTLPGFTLNRLFTIRVKYDDMRDSIWMFFKSNHNEYYQTALNLTDLTWTSPEETNSTIASHLWLNAYSGTIEMARIDDIPLIFHPNGSADLYYCGMQLTKVTTHPGADFMVNWTEPVAVGPPGHLRFLQDKFVVMWEADRDTWINVYSTGWVPLGSDVRVTSDYPEEASVLIQHGAQYFVLAEQHTRLIWYRSIDSTLTTWTIQTITPTYLGL